MHIDDGKGFVDGLRLGSRLGWTLFRITKQFEQLFIVLQLQNTFEYVMEVSSPTRWMNPNDLIFSIKYCYLYFFGFILT